MKHMIKKSLCIVLSIITVLSMIVSLSVSSVAAEPIEEGYGDIMETEPITEPETTAITEAPTEPPTEAPETMPPTEPLETEPITEAPTQPTEAPTQPATEPPTQPTEAPTQLATEPPTQPTEVPTEIITDPPTQPTEVPTQPTEVPTELPTEVTTQPTYTPTEPIVQPTQAPTEQTDPSENIEIPTYSTEPIEESSHVIYFDASTLPKWENATFVYFHIWYPNSDAFYGWQSKAERGEKIGNGLWKYDLDQHGIGLLSNQALIIFSTNTGLQTYDLLMDSNCYGDTAYCNGIMFENPTDSDKKSYGAFWQHQDPYVNGPKMYISGSGNVTGIAIQRDSSAQDMLVSFFYNNIDEARQHSMKNDQDLIDGIKESLGLSDKEVSNIIKRYGFSIDWIPLADIEDYIGKNVIYLDTSKVSELVKDQSYLYCNVNGKHLAKRIDKNIWIVDLDTIVTDGKEASADISIASNYIIQPSLKKIVVYGDEFQSYSCYFDESCYNDTLVIDDEIVNSYNFWYDKDDLYLAHWKNSDNSKYGSVKSFDSNNNLIGNAIPDFHQRLELLRWFVEYSLPEIGNTTIETDQYIIDNMAAQLGMKKDDVECLIDDKTLWNPDDSELPDGYSYDVGAYYLIKTDMDKPLGYHEFKLDGETGFYAVYSYSPNKITESGGSTSSGSSSSSSSSKSAPPEHDFTPNDKYEVVRYDGGDKFTVVSKDSITTYNGVFYFFKSDNEKYCFGYNISSEIGDNGSSSGSSYGGSSYYSLSNPIINSITNTEKGLKIEWKAVNGAEQYRVYVKTDTSWKGLVNTSDTSYVFKNAKSGNAYTFTVRCISADGKVFMSDYNDGKSARRIETPQVTMIQSLSEGNKITWTPVPGNARYRVSVKSRNTWKVLGDTYDTCFIHSSQGEGSIYAQQDVEYTYTVVCVSYSGKAIVSDFYQTGWTVTYTGDGTIKEFKNESPVDEPDDPITPEPSEPYSQSSKTDISKWTVKGIKNKTYTGKAIKQDILVSNDGKFADCTVKYKNNVFAGTATVIITGTGEYTGTITKTFKITKAKNAITVKTATKTVKLSKVKKAKQTVKPITVSKAQGKVTYKLTGVPKSLGKLVKISSKGAITISKWKKAKSGNYKIKLNISVKGNDNYKSKSINKTVTIKVK